MNSNRVVFKNSGVIDLRGILTFGLSAKETSNPIGYFGTGLKYAIAILLREGCKVTLYAGLSKYEFNKKNIEMRGKSFELLTMNDSELPFTTELGKNWKLWQAFRELYCNCLDESGLIYQDSGEIIPSEDTTYFVIEDDNFKECYINRNLYFLNIPAHLELCSEGVQIYNQPSDAVYYRGIRVGDLSPPSNLTYNILHPVDLTEDRTLKYSSYELRKLPIYVGKIKDKSVVKSALTARKGSLEFEFDYTDIGHHPVSEEFLDVLSKEYQLNNDHLNLTSIKYLRTKLDIKDTKIRIPEKLTDVEVMQLRRATSIISKVFSNFVYDIIVVKDLGQYTMALADKDSREIILSKRVFKMGTKYLTSTLIEEYMHIETGYGDCTRELQTHLFDTICSLIEDHVVREPI